MSHTQFLAIAASCLALASCSASKEPETPAADTAATGTIVTRENFTRAESDHYFQDIAALSGGTVNRFAHVRAPTPLDQQTIIRMNRDTLYSGAIIDTGGAGATITVPKMPDGRYASVLLIDNDHYYVGVIYEPGVHKVPAATRHVAAAIRIEVFNPNDPREIALVNSLQDQFAIQASSAEPLPPFQWDRASLDKVRAELVEGSQRFPHWEGAMGPRGKVDPEKHLYATASAWGLFPENHATYFKYNPGHSSSGCYTATYVVPKNEAFWSITMYGKSGFIESENSVLNGNNTRLAPDGNSFTAYFGSKEACGDVPNRLDTTEGWNFIMRVYRPDPSVLGGGYVLPATKPVKRAGAQA